MIKVISAELPRRTSVDELLETIFERSGIVRDGRGCVVDARSAGTCADWECLEHRMIKVI